MLRIGLTGGIGSGKTTVARIFSVLGIPVYDSDSASKRLMAEDELLKDKIIQHFGKESYLNGNLNRKYLSELVFSDPQKDRVVEFNRSSRNDQRCRRMDEKAKCPLHY